MFSDIVYKLSITPEPTLYLLTLGAFILLARLYWSDLRIKLFYWHSLLFIGALVTFVLSLVFVSSVSPQSDFACISGYLAPYPLAILMLLESVYFIFKNIKTSELQPAVFVMIVLKTVLYLWLLILTFRSAGICF